LIFVSWPQNKIKAITEPEFRIRVPLCRNYFISISKVLIFLLCV